MDFLAGLVALLVLAGYSVYFYMETEHWPWYRVFASVNQDQKEQEEPGLYPIIKDYEWYQQLHNIERRKM